MDAEALKIILKLQEENIELKKTISLAIGMLTSRKEYFDLMPDNKSASWLIKEVQDILSDFNKVQQLANNTDAKKL